MSAAVEPYLLVFNSGSSSFKFSLYRQTDLAPLLRGQAERLSSAEARLQLPDKTVELPGADHTKALEAVVQALSERGFELERCAGAGHRIVHGGEHFRASVRVTPSVRAEIDRAGRLAPLHNPSNLLGIDWLCQRRPSLMQVAVFDTAFHQTLPPKAFLYAVPYRLYEHAGVRRYGFHGISHRFVASAACERLQRQADDCQLLVAHLGNGCSATAVKNGASVDTSMGLTPLEGLVMGTRSGDVDPGLHQYLADSQQLSLAEINQLLNRESGLKGLSGLSGDMRTLTEAAERGDARAELAIEVFCYRLGRSLGGLATALTRIDALVFTGGIGEHSARVRAATLRQLAILGFAVDEARNSAHGRRSDGWISPPGAVPALVIATDEEHAIASDTADLIAGAQ